MLCIGVLPLQVSRILFEVLKLAPPPCAKDLKSGGYSTGQEVRLPLCSARVRVWEYGGEVAWTGLQGWLQAAAAAACDVHGGGWALSAAACRLGSAEEAPAHLHVHHTHACTPL